MEGESSPKVKSSKVGITDGKLVNILVPKLSRKRPTKGEIVSNAWSFTKVEKINYVFKKSETDTYSIRAHRSSPILFGDIDVNKIRTSKKKPSFRSIN